jgi:hypothetical protein
VNHIDVILSDDKKLNNNKFCFILEVLYNEVLGGSLKKGLILKVIDMMFSQKSLFLLKLFFSRVNLLQKIINV